MVFLGDVDLSLLLPVFRSKKNELSINERFLKTQDKNLILKNLQFGFRADWSPKMPPVGTTPVYFLIGPDAIKKARQRFKNEMEKGRMLGGVGWTRKRVESFLGKKKVTLYRVGRFQKMVTKTDELFTIIATRIIAPYQ